MAVRYVVMQGINILQENGIYVIFDKKQMQPSFLFLFFFYLNLTSLSFCTQHCPFYFFLYFILLSSHSVFLLISTPTYLCILIWFDAHFKSFLPPILHVLHNFTSAVLQPSLHPRFRASTRRPLQTRWQGGSLSGGSVGVCV